MFFLLIHIQGGIEKFVGYFHLVDIFIEIAKKTICFSFLIL